MHLITYSISNSPNSLFAPACHATKKMHSIFSYEHNMTGNSYYQSMLHIIYVALPFLVFAITNLEPFSKLIHQHKNVTFSFRSPVICIAFLIFEHLSFNLMCKKSTTFSSSVFTISLCFFHHLFFSSQLISSHLPLVLCFSILFLLVLPICFCPCVLLSVPSPPTLFRLFSSSNMNVRNNLLSRGNSWPSRSRS